MSDKKKQLEPMSDLIPFNEPNGLFWGPHEKFLEQLKLGLYIFYHLFYCIPSWHYLKRFLSYTKKKEPYVFRYIRAGKVGFNQFWFGILNHKVCKVSYLPMLHFVKRSPSEKFQYSWQISNTLNDKACFIRKIADF